MFFFPAFPQYHATRFAWRSVDRPDWSKVCWKICCFTTSATARWRLGYYLSSGKPGPHPLNTSKSVYAPVGHAGLHLNVTIYTVQHSQRSFTVQIIPDFTPACKFQIPWAEFVSLLYTRRNLKSRSAAQLAKTELWMSDLLTFTKKKKDVIPQPSEQFRFRLCFDLLIFIVLM